MSPKSNQYSIKNLIILPYKQYKSKNKELELSLSLWRKFCKFNYHFVVIGEYDDYLIRKFPWIEFIYCELKEKIDNQYNAHLDIQNKFKIIENKYSKEYDGFIHMSDDKYAIKPFYIEDITYTHYKSLNCVGFEHQPTWYWNHDKWKTRQLLDKENLPHINYTTHYPYYYEFSKIKEIREKYNLLEESYVFEDIYFNYFEHDDPILAHEIRLGIWNKDIYENEFENALKNPKIKFVCNSIEGWSKELENDLENLI